MRQNMTLRILPLLVLGVFAGCNNGSSGGGPSTTAIEEAEPNDDATTANGLVVGETASGNVADGTDSDFWSIDLAADELISIEAFANRLDQATWATAGNFTKITVYDTDGTTALLEQSAEISDWGNDQDTDIDVFRAPAAGTYYVAVDVSDALSTGGDYLVTIKNVVLPTPVQFETELEGISGSNDTDATAEAIVPGTVFGFHVDDESDFYSFEVTEPVLLRFETRAFRNGAWKGGTYFDPEIHLYDPTVSNLFTDDDTYYYDSSIEYVATTAGTYFLEVQECCADGDSGYALIFEMTPLTDLSLVSEVEPNDTTGAAQVIQFGDMVEGNASGADDDFYSVACSAGDRIRIQVFDSDNSDDMADRVILDVLDSGTSSIALNNNGGLKVTRAILDSTDTYFIQVNAETSATDYRFIVTQIGSGFESEPNDLVADAGTFDADGHAAGVIDVNGDADLFEFSGTAGVPIVFSCLASTNSSPNGFSDLDDFGSTLVPLLKVLDATTAVLATSDANVGAAVGTIRGLDSTTLVFVPPTTGTFYLSVEDWDASSSDTHLYTVIMD
jgi:hypothetical protein